MVSVAPHRPILAICRRAVACGTGIFLAVLPVTCRAQPSAAATEAPGLSVVDLIALTRFGSREFGDSDADQAVVSPDRERVASVTQRGVLASNTREFHLLIVSNDKRGDGPAVNAYAMFSTSSNRPAISQLTWLSNDRLAFLAERPDEFPQVYTLDIPTHDLIQRTHAAEPVTVFDASPGGRTIVYATERPQTSPSAFRSLREHGFAIPSSMPISEIVEGKWSRATTISDTEVLHVAKNGAETTVSLPDATTYGACELGGPYASESFSLAPTGDLVLLKCRPKRPPDSWTLYREKNFRREEASGAQYPWWIVLNLQTGAAQPLTGAAAMNFDSKPLWTRDGESVIVLDDLSPLEGDSAIERNRRAAARLTVEIHLSSRLTELITDQRPIRLTTWNPQLPQLQLELASPGGSRSHFASFSKATTRWVEEETSATDTAESVVVVHQGFNEPWHLVQENSAARATLLYDPNVDLMAHRRRADETVIRWQTKSGAKLSAGLYLRSTTSGADAIHSRSKPMDSMITPLRPMAFRRQDLPRSHWRPLGSWWSKLTSVPHIAACQGTSRPPKENSSNRHGNRSSTISMISH